MTAATGPVIYAGEALMAELAACEPPTEEGFKHFLRRHVYIRDVYPDAVSGASRTRTIQWQWWDFHDELVHDLFTEPRLAWLKARQQGFSWLTAALHVKDAIFMRGYLGGVTSAGQNEATSFLVDKCKFIAEHLPWRALPPFSVSNSQELRFSGSNGAIFAYPSTPKGGIGETFNRFTADEAAHHAYGEENYAEYAPATEHGQIIILSSMAGEEANVLTNDWFQRHWTAARDGRNGFAARFYPYNMRPGRDAAWKEKEQRRLSGQPGAFGRQYPETPEDAFRSFMGLRFDPVAIEAGKATCRPPLGEAYGLPELLVDAASKGHLRIWSRTRPGVPYVAYTDPAEGKGRDFTVTGIMEARSMRHVATLRENVLEQGDHGRLAAALCRWYNEAYWGVERAKGEGIALVIGLEQYHISRRYHHVEDRTFNQVLKGLEPPGGSFGFPMTEHSRVGLLDDLAQVLVDGAFSSDDELLWKECGTFIINAQGRAEAGRGSHDDLVIMAAGMVRMARQPGAQTVRRRPSAVAVRTTQGYGYYNPRGNRVTLNR